MHIVHHIVEGYRSGHNEAVLKIVWGNPRGFESHTLRQQKQNICLPTNVLFLFIQAAGLAYHRRTKCGVYHQLLWGCISSRASVYLTCGLMIYTPFGVSGCEKLFLISVGILTA